MGRLKEPLEEWDYFDSADAFQHTLSLNSLRI